MALVGGELGYRILRRISNGADGGHVDGRAFIGRSKLAVLLGSASVERLRGQSVLDFGCGEGAEAIEIAQLGARRVVGLDIQPGMLEVGRAAARTAGLEDRVEFTNSTAEEFDFIVSLDAFEHFGDPAAILSLMYQRLKPGGEVLISFGPTWYHPLGGHLFSVFPWAHLIFTEEALIRWRSDFKTDGATKFSEVQGGLNQMTIRRFETIVAASPFTIERLEPVPIRRLRALAGPLTREFTTAVVRATLKKPS